MKNQEVAKLLYEIAEILELKGVEFKPRAYRKAARNIESLSVDVMELMKDGNLRSIPGVGVNIAKKIDEFLRTGKLRYYEKLRRSAPVKIEELSAIPGLGPKRIKLLYSKLGIINLNDLKEAALKHRIQQIPSLGPKVEREILLGIGLMKKYGKRYILGYMMPLAEKIRSRLLNCPYISSAEIAGSYRRGKETIGDIDILITTRRPKDAISLFTSMEDTARVTAKGSKKVSIRLNNGIQVDMRIVKSSEFGSAMQYFTGNKYHNISLRKTAIKKGYRLSEYGLFRIKDNRRIAGRTEESVYRKLGMQYIPPEMRTNSGEIKLAVEKKLPVLVERKEIKADFQMHTRWSDGSFSIDEMIEESRKLGHKVIAITDHAGYLKVANALEGRRFEKYVRAIEKADKHSEIKVLKGAEIDIDKKGDLVIKKSMLNKLDIVLGSIHMGFKESSRDMTRRIIGALEKYPIDILAHPTARLLNKREPISFDKERVFQAAKDTDTLLEINCHPERMDLNGEDIRLARSIGCSFAAGTDSHTTENLRYIDLGVSLARRGWLRNRDIINTFSVKKIMRSLKSS